MKRLLQILFWSIIPAAFIGPGTVTTAASAGTRFGYTLLWALVFSTVATVVLQEASARVTVVSGRNLGEAIRDRFGGGVSGWLVLGLVLGAIVLGNAAFEAGNILGASAGAALGTGLSGPLLPLAIGAVAAGVLWIGTPKTVATLLSLTVAVMGIAFLATALLLQPPAGEVLRGSVVPASPAGTGLLVLGLVGTTVVPYNLFLGSGIAAGQKLGEIRFGITVAVVLGGIISMGIVVVGAGVEGEFSYEAVAATLSGRLGAWAGPLFAWGLFAAGLSSAITAPLAAAITARALYGDGSERWSDRGARFRAVWLGVLLVGVAFGVAGVRPIPAIILAQALNGVVLPFAAVFLLLVVNDRVVMGERGINGPVSNTLMAATVAVTLVLGVSGVLRAGASAAGVAEPREGTILLASAGIAAVLLVPVLRGVRRRRGGALPVREAEPAGG
ncbi:MAG TPA: divalent metal cation transporter [Longimicrobiaceae bacterium]|nr:divalent metal cation transporter [Longimicrobiaceae bacterium]